MRVLLSEETQSRYHLVKSILLYQNSAEPETIAIEHDIRAHNGKAQLGPGRFVTADFVMQLLRLLDATPLEYLAPNVIASSRNAVAWFEPATVRPMFFTATTDLAVNVFDAKLLAQPPLLFIARQRGLHVYALFENQRPSPNTSLAFAPYFNVSDHHSVCLGSMPLPKTISPNDVGSWSHAFFGSNFTHFSGMTKHWAHPGTYAELLADVTLEATFRSEWLKPTSLTVHDALCTH